MLALKWDDFEIQRTLRPNDQSAYRASLFGTEVVLWLLSESDKIHKCVHPRHALAPTSLAQFRPPAPPKSLPFSRSVHRGLQAVPGERVRAALCRLA